MINFIEGRITLSEKEISASSDYDDLDSLAKEGLVEKRKNGRGETYYYVESGEDGMRLGVFVRLREKKIQWIVLRWLNGPCTSKGWDDVSEGLLKDEYRLLLNFVETRAGCPPTNKMNRQRIWYFGWGQVDVSYEPRDFAVAIFMKPKLAVTN